MITEHVYDGVAWCKTESSAKHKRPQKPPSVYQRLKNMYDREMSEMSEARELSEEYKRARKAMNRTFFDTKVAQVLKIEYSKKIIFFLNRSGVFKLYS